MPSKCMKSRYTGKGRVIPLDRTSAENMGWGTDQKFPSYTEIKLIESHKLSSDIRLALLEPADVPDNKSNTPNHFRLALFKETHTIAEYNNHNNTGTVTYYSPSIQEC